MKIIENVRCKMPLRLERLLGKQIWQKPLESGHVLIFHPLWKKFEKPEKKYYRLEKKIQRVKDRLKIRKANINYFADTFIIFNPQL